MSDDVVSPSWTRDITAGFFVFLLALPLCLGIALASGVPAVAGILTAVVGGCVATWAGSAALTIKGPAAGLIVIVLGAVQELGAGDPMLGYRRTLAVGAIAALVQMGLAFARAGLLAEVFPPSVIHGMLAAIGVIIFSKQVHVLLGVKPEASEPLHLLAEIPHSLSQANPEIVLLGILSLAVMLLHPLVRERLGRWARIPAPLLVLLVAVPLGLWFQLGVEHTYSWGGHSFPIGPRFLVNLPENLLAAVAFPDFSALPTLPFWKYVVMFALVGSVESLLTVKAVEILDPRRRRNDLDRDLLATGIGNLVAAGIGGIPMISEVVRSSANISYGAETRRSNFFHGAFLLFFVALIPGLIHEIPLAALAAMLIAVGFRLAAPSQFAHALRIGPEQLAVFVVTLLTTLAIDLLVGVLAGVTCEILLQVLRGVSLPSLLRSDIEERKGKGSTTTIAPRGAAVFSNFLGLRRHLAAVAGDARVTVDLSRTLVVDHTVMERLHQMADDFRRRGGELVIAGLDSHAAVSSHPSAERRRRPAPRGKRGTRR